MLTFARAVARHRSSKGAWHETAAAAVSHNVATLLSVPAQTSSNEISPNHISHATSSTFGGASPATVTSPETAAADPTLAISSNARSTVQRLTSGHSAAVAPRSAAAEGGMLWQQLATGPLSRGGLAQSVRHARVTGSEVELRDVQTGLKSNEKLRTSEHIELVFSDDKPFVFLYVDEDNACLMEKQTFEQISLPVSMFGDAAPLLQDGMEVVVHLFNGKALSASLPARVSDVVDEAEPFFKGQTAAPSYDPSSLPAP
ncbi:unnamed protein product, partial [Closterium sp. NIES-53]